MTELSTTEAKQVYEEMGQFAAKAFPDASSYEHLLKLEQEAVEAQVDAGNIEEYADCLLCLFGAAHKAGFSFEDLLKSAKNKLERCQSRKWKKMPDGTYQHIESQ